MNLFLVVILTTDSCVQLAVPFKIKQATLLLSISVSLLDLWFNDVNMVTITDIVKGKRKRTRKDLAIVEEDSMWRPLILYN